MCVPKSSSFVHVEIPALECLCRWTSLCAVTCICCGYVKTAIFVLACFWTLNENFYTLLNTEGLFVFLSFSMLCLCLCLCVCFWQFCLWSLKKLLYVSECVSVSALRAGAVIVKCFSELLVVVSDSYGLTRARGIHFEKRVVWHAK